MNSLEKFASFKDGSGFAADSWMGHENTVGIIGGLSASSTAIFLAKLVWGSSRNEKESVPFIVCSDSTIKSELSMYSTRSNDSRIQLHRGVIIENLRCKMAFLEQSGARCIVMPCHVSHVWYREISNGCSVTFLNAGDCVASELKEAKLKPLEGGSKVRVGVLARDTPLVGTFYQEKLQRQVNCQLPAAILFSRNALTLWILWPDQLSNGRDQLKMAWHIELG